MRSWRVFLTAAVAVMAAFPGPVSARGQAVTLPKVTVVASGLNNPRGRSMANFAAADQAGLVRIVKRKLKKIQYRPHLIDGCLAGTGLIIAACRDRVDQGLQLRRRGRLGPCGPPALQHGPGGKPGADRAQRPRPGRRRRRSGGVRPPSLRHRAWAAVPRHAAAGDRRTRRPSRMRMRS
jgi:hypothetical protein